MITIQLALFAFFSSRHPVKGVGRSAAPVQIAEGTTLGELIEQIGLTNEQRITFVNGRHADDDRVLVEDDRVAVFPPIAGG